MFFEISTRLLLNAGVCLHFKKGNKVNFEKKIERLPRKRKFEPEQTLRLPEKIISSYIGV